MENIKKDIKEGVKKDVKVSDVKILKTEKGNGYWRVNDYTQQINYLLREYKTCPKDDVEQRKLITSELNFINKLYSDQQSRKRWDKFFYTFILIGLAFFVMAMLITMGTISIPHSEELIITFFSYFIAEKIGIATYLGVEIRATNRK